jgi:hypothetical protein
MRNWMIPVAVLGLGGLAALALSDRGQELVRDIFEQIEGESEETLRAITEWNDAAQHELDRLQVAVSQIAQTLSAETVR